MGGNSKHADCLLLDGLAGERDFQVMEIDEYVILFYIFLLLCFAVINLLIFFEVAEKCLLNCVGLFSACGGTVFQRI